MAFIPVNQPLLNGNEKKYVLECLESGWISAEGPFVEKFETEFAGLVGREHAIAVSSGTAALEAAVAALGFDKNTEIIIPSFTIISCAAAVLKAGAIPVLVDSDPLTWNMDVNLIEAKITPKTRAIMIVHIYGLPVDLDPVLNLAQRYNLKIIEDASEMHGQTYKGRPCGSFGDISTFSFYSNKFITTGEGGMIVTNDEVLAERCRSLRNLCFLPERRFVHEEIGSNFRMSNLQAALGVAQLERLSYIVAKKRNIGKLYTNLLSGTPDLWLPLEKTSYAENIYWVYGIVLKDEFPFDARTVIEELKENSIGSRPFFWPMHQQPVLQKLGLFQNESYPVAEKIARRGLYLPNGLGLTTTELEIVAVTLKKILAEKSK